MDNVGKHNICTSFHISSIYSSPIADAYILPYVHLSCLRFHTEAAYTEYWHSQKKPYIRRKAKSPPWSSTNCTKCLDSRMRPPTLLTEFIRRLSMSLYLKNTKKPKIFSCIPRSHSVVCAQVYRFQTTARHTYTQSRRHNAGWLGQYNKEQRSSLGKHINILP
jgi:hypothetical protein